ncbi:hypothetical protein [Burkholderia ubonensis]|uniref:hypothetical protein n=1 Tax=Burkholderia ubonensis TaxID=101571 RepID=UPI000B037BCD|nr:hypothetical protein [Burkholderia ubonensis]
MTKFLKTLLNIKSKDWIAVSPKPSVAMFAPAADLKLVPAHEDAENVLSTELEKIAKKVAFTHETSEGNFKLIVSGKEGLQSQTKLAVKLGAQSNVFKGLNDSIKGKREILRT